MYFLIFYSVVKHYLANAKTMDLNIQDNNGNTPLHTACEKGNIDIAKALLTAGKVNLHGVKS